jgi:hypothetical protein
MPEHVYTAPYPGVFPHQRDGLNVPLGHVEPGDIRELDEPLDHRWREATDEDRAALAERTEQRRVAALIAGLKAEGLSDEEIEQVLAAGAEDGEQGASTPPALPKRSKRADTTETAGTAGSEES